MRNEYVKQITAAKDSERMSVLTNKIHSYKRKKSNNSGFTLVELIVVLVLMTIMLSVTLFGALGWIDWSRFQQENSNAEVIFYAAQNQLTSMDASGSIKRMLSDIRTDDDENYDHLWYINDDCLYIDTYYNEGDDD